MTSGSAVVGRVTVTTWVSRTEPITASAATNASMAPAAARMILRRLLIAGSFAIEAGCFAIKIAGELSLLPVWVGGHGLVCVPRRRRSRRLHRPTLRSEEHTFELQ